jgi:acyl-CoA synthetase (AMP-forming)/AMP-acid ligase II
MFVYAKTTHRNLTSVLTVIQPALPVHHGLDVFVGVLPFYHIYGALDLTSAMLSANQRM